MKEAQLQTWFGKYLIANPPMLDGQYVSEFHELKRTKNPSLPFNALRQ